jgi:hypothetical protein
LPLTAILTVLLWLYADAHLTATQHDVPIKVRFAAAGNHHSMTVSAVSPKGGTFQIDISGRKSVVSQVANQLFGRAMLTAVDRRDLTCELNNNHFKYGKIYTFNTVKLLNALPYFTRRHLAVISARPRSTELVFDRLVHIRRPIAFTSLPGVNVVIKPATAVVTIAGSTLNRIGGADEISVEAQPLQSLTGLPPGSKQRIEAQLIVNYPGTVRHVVRVSPSTAVISFVAPRATLKVLHVGTVPIWVQGPPWILRRYRVRIRPASVPVTVSGAARTIGHLETELALGASAPINEQIIGVVSLPPSAKRSQHWVNHSVHFVLPSGVSLVKSPRTVKIKITRHSNAAPASVLPATTQPAVQP